MNKDVIKAELNTAGKLSLQSWEASAAEVVTRPRETRSSKPEVVYRFTPLDKFPIVQQPSTPQSTPRAQAAARDVPLSQEFPRPILPQRLKLFDTQASDVYRATDD